MKNHEIEAVLPILDHHIGEVTTINGRESVIVGITIKMTINDVVDISYQYTPTDLVKEYEIKGETMC